MKKLFCQAALVVAAMLANVAQAASVAVIQCSSPITYLGGFGFTVTDFNNPVGLTAGSLAGYDAAVAASNCVFSDPTGIGNALKGFADAGGGVVLTEFDFQGQWQLGGGIVTPGYSPFVNDPLSSGYANAVVLGTIFDPGSPLFAGLSTAGIANNFNALVGLDPGATLVADWSNGRHAIAFNSLASSSIVGLNGFFADGYVGADDQRLLANAINFSLSANNGIPEPGTLSLIGLALAGLAASRRRKQ